MMTDINQPIKLLSERIATIALNYLDPVITIGWDAKIGISDYHQIDSNYIMIEREYATLLALQHPNMYVFEVNDIIGAIYPREY